jgi:hypothetical protein
MDDSVPEAPATPKDQGTIKREHEYWAGYAKCAAQFPPSDYGANSYTSEQVKQLQAIEAAKAKRDALAWVLGELESLRG